MSRNGFNGSLKNKAILVKSQKDAKFTEAVPVTAYKNPEIISRTPSPISSDNDLRCCSSTNATAHKSSQVPRPKSRKILAAEPAAGGSVDDDYSGSEQCRKVRYPGVGVLYKKPKGVVKVYPTNSMSLWLEQTDALADRWGGSDDGDGDMEWENQYYPKTHWKTRKALADQEETLEVDDEELDECEIEEKDELRADRKRSRV